MPVANFVLIAIKGAIDKANFDISVQYRVIWGILWVLCTLFGLAISKISEDKRCKIATTSKRAREDLTEKHESLNFRAAWDYVKGRSIGLFVTTMLVHITFPGFFFGSTVSFR
jgi:hypothetical protein